MSKLTPKQKLFVNEYLIDLNASAACLRAGYKSKNPDVDGYHLLVKPSISSAIKNAMVERERRTEVTQDMVVKQLAKIAFLDIKDVVTWSDEGIKVRPSNEVDGTVLNEVSETLSEGGWTKKVKMSDRMKALDMLGRHLGMFKEKLDVDMKSQVVFTNEPPDDD